MSGRVAVIGSGGYLGQALLRRLPGAGFETVGLSRHPAGDGRSIRCDATDPAALINALADTDVVVNAMAGTPAAMRRVACAVAAALDRLPRLRLVQISSLAIFGQTEGSFDESASPWPRPGHAYAEAKLYSELVLRSDRGRARRCVIIRPGCIYGPHSRRWVDDVCRLLLAGRLGWLGPEGAGCAPLVHVYDVAAAIETALSSHVPAGIHHIVSPETLGWNQYFRRIGWLLGIDAVPRIGRAALEAETWIFGPARHMIDRVLSRPASTITPSMRHLFRSQAQFVSARASLLHQHTYIPHSTGFADAVDAFVTSSPNRGLSRWQRWPAL
jgi:nucleoside-diphosphate-sugar epimerase